MYTVSKQNRFILPSSYHANVYVLISVKFLLLISRVYVSMHSTKQFLKSPATKQKQAQGLINKDHFPVDYTMEINLG